MILLFTGNGKGKTTASLGQMLRAMGRGKRTLMIQFIKGPWESGEDRFGERFNIPKETFEVRKMGLGFVGILGDKIPRADHEAAARLALDAFIAAKEAGTWHTIILDEVNVAADLGLIPIEDVVQAVADYPLEKVLLMTGRGAPQAFIDVADLATEMKEIKHPFNDGEKAKYAVEF